jgi:homoserine O-succinyltransferase
MTPVFDKHRRISSPALAPRDDDFDRLDQPELTIGLINNMPDTALKATERQFKRLLGTAAGMMRVRLHCFSLPSVMRSPAAKQHVDDGYEDITDLDRLGLDALIVTGAEPNAATLPEEAFWRDLTGIIDWAKTNTRSTIWSCLAAHAAVLYLDGIERQRLDVKCSGLFDCVKVTDDWLTRGIPSPLKVPHSRLNAVREGDLIAKGYQILTRSDLAGVDIFTRQLQSSFIFFQGHPEYDALTLQREYMRDVARFLSGERAVYPAVPVSYFDAATEVVLARFQEHARRERDPTLAAELPGLTLRPNNVAGAVATIIFRNWLSFLAEGARATMPAR